MIGTNQRLGREVADELADVVDLAPARRGDLKGRGLVAEGSHRHQRGAAQPVL